MKDIHSRTKVNYERELMAMAILGKSGGERPLNRSLFSGSS